MKTEFNVKECLNILLQGKICFAIRKNKKIYFALKKDKIFVQDLNSSFYLSESEFLSLYQNNIFLIEDFSDKSIDSEKDQEYYSLNVLKY